MCMTKDGSGSLGDAIIRFVEARRRVPEEWIYEYNELANTVEIFEEENK